MILMLLGSLAARADDCSTEAKAGYLRVLSAQQGLNVDTAFQIDISSDEIQVKRDNGKKKFNPPVSIRRSYSSGKITYDNFQVLDGAKVGQISPSRFRTIVFFFWSDIAASVPAGKRPANREEFEKGDWVKLQSGGALTYDAGAEALTYQLPNSKGYIIADVAATSPDRNGMTSLATQNTEEKFDGHFDIDPVTCLPVHSRGIIRAGHALFSYINITFDLNFKTYTGPSAVLTAPSTIKMRADWKIKGPFSDPDFHTAEIKVTPIN